MIETTIGLDERKALLDLDEHSVICLRYILSAAVRVASQETAYPPDRATWTPADPLHGHCGVVAYIVNVILGGEIVSGRDADGSRWIWNRLPNGVQVALTSKDPFRPPAKGRVLTKRKTVNNRYYKFLLLMEEEIPKCL